MERIAESSLRFEVFSNISIHVQQLRASFMLLVFLTSFGRCWAEQCGLLAGSNWACCPIEASAHGSHGHLAPDGCDHDSPEHPHEDENIPLRSPGEGPPCEVCELIQSGFIGLSSSLEIPAPIFSLVEIPWFSQWSVFNLSLRNNCLDEPLVYGPPDDLSSISTSRLVTSTTVSVRGPNVK